MTLDFTNTPLEEAFDKFRQIIDELSLNEDSVDIIIETGSNYEVSGAILQLIDSLDLDHQISIGGRIEVNF
jgi:hypothetical protein